MERRTKNEVRDVSVVSVRSTTPARSGDVTRRIDSYTVRRKRRVEVGGGCVGEAKEGGCGSVDSFRVVEELTEEEVACAGKEASVGQEGVRGRKMDAQTGREGMLRQACKGKIREATSVPTS